MSLDILPNELIDCIANNLNYIDLANLLQVNSRLNSHISNYNGLWQQSFRKQWPTLYAEVFQPMEQPATNWRFETIQCHLVCVKIYKELCQMSARYHQKDELSDVCFDCFRQMTTDDRHNCVLDQLENIVNTVDEMKYDLTIKYYARKVIRSLRTELVRKKWIRMVEELNYTRLAEALPPVDISQPDQHDVPGDLVTGSVLIAQYFQPNTTISETEIRKKIRVIALKAVKVLREMFPSNYLVTQRKGELLSQFDASHLTESISEPKDCIEVIHAINDVMYRGTSRFDGNRENYYLASNSYIDKVLTLKLGIPILLCVVYQAVAALLGVKLFPIGQTGHFLLAFRAKLHFLDRNQQFTYIDPFNDGKLLSDEEVSELGLNVVVIPSRPLSVFMRMASNLILVGKKQVHFSESVQILRNGAELGNLISEEDIEMQIMLNRVYLALDINHERMLEISNRLDHLFGINRLVDLVNSRMGLVKQPPVVMYRRNMPGVQFAVGMVMRYHKLDVICVICGWAENYTDEMQGEYNADDDENILFYKVIVADGTIRYTPQDQLSIERRTNAKIEDPKIGRYFTRFNGRNYELNEEIRCLFPDDERALDEIYQKLTK